MKVKIHPIDYAKLVEGIEGHEVRLICTDCKQKYLVTSYEVITTCPKCGAGVVLIQ